MNYYRRKYYRDKWILEHGDKKYKSGSIFIGYNIHPYILLRISDKNEYALFNITTGEYWSEPKIIDGDVDVNDLVRLGIDDNFVPFVTPKIKEPEPPKDNNNNNNIDVDELIRMIENKNNLSNIKIGEK